MNIALETLGLVNKLDELVNDNEWLIGNDKVRARQLWKELANHLVDAQPKDTPDRLMYYRNGNIEGFVLSGNTELRSGRRCVAPKVEYIENGGDYIHSHVMGVLKPILKDQAAKQ